MITRANGQLHNVLPVIPPARIRFSAVAAIFGFLALMMISNLAAPVAWAQGSGTKLMANGEKSLSAGEYDAAIDQLSKAIKSGSLGKPEMARAFVMRGQALQGKDSQARAVADFTNALWLESLTGADTARALALRGTSRQKLGQSKAAADDFKKAEAAQPGVSRQVGGTAVAARGVTAAPQAEAAGEEGGFFSSLFGGNSDQPPAERVVARRGTGKVARTRVRGDDPVRRRTIGENTSSGGVFNNLFGGGDAGDTDAASGPRQLASSGQDTGTRRRLIPTSPSAVDADNINRPGVLTDILPSGASETTPKRKPGTQAIAAPGATRQNQRDLNPPDEEPGFFERVFSGRSQDRSNRTAAASNDGPRRLVGPSDGPPVSGRARAASAEPRTQRDTSLPTFVNQPRLTDRILANDAVEPGGNAGAPTRIASVRQPARGLQPASRRVDAPTVAVEPAQLDWNQTTRVERGQVNSPIAAPRPRAVPRAASRSTTRVAARTPAPVRPAPVTRRPVVANTRAPQADRRQIQPATARTQQNQRTFGSRVRTASNTAGSAVRSAVDWVGGVIGSNRDQVAPPARPRQVASAPVRHQAHTNYRAPQKPAARRQAATAGGGYVLQLAARQRRSDAEAAARAVSARHSGILGGAKPFIIRADIAGKGTYYRVRVGPYRTKAQVSSICAQLKGKGQDCFATR